MRGSLRHSGFRTGLGVFTCPSCGRKTRGMSDNNAEVCSQCNEYEEHLNFHSDRGVPLENCAECVRLKDEIKKKGGVIHE